MNWWFPTVGKLVLGVESEFGIILGDNIQSYALYQMGGLLGYQGKLRGYQAGSIGGGRVGRSFFSYTTELTYPVVENTFFTCWASSMREGATSSAVCWNMIPPSASAITIPIPREDQAPEPLVGNRFLGSAPRRGLRIPRGGAAGGAPSAWASISAGRSTTSKITAARRYKAVGYTPEVQFTIEQGF